MRIAIVTPKIVGGDGQARVNLEVAECLLSRGHHLVLLTHAVPTTLAQHPRVTWIQPPGASWPTVLLRELAMMWYTRRWLRQNREAVDGVFANGCITWAPADVSVAHFVHHAWKHSPYKDEEYGPRAWYHSLYTTLNVRWEHRAFTTAKQVVAVSDHVRRELIEAGVTDDQIEVIPNGVDPEEFSPGPEDRPSLGLPSDGPLALFVGDLRTKRKNLDTVLHALRTVPSLELAVAGDTAGSPFPALSRSLAVDARTHFLGFRSDVPALMRAADITVCPSRYEPFSLVVLESLASGTPVVTTQNVGAASLLDESCSIVLDDPEDVEALSAALTWMVQNPDQRAKMGEAGRTLALDHTWSAMAESYASLIERTCDAEESSASSASVPADSLPSASLHL
jgi:glycosyltransferase involved in cell wall biosynthesis